MPSPFDESPPSLALNSHFLENDHDHPSSSFDEPSSDGDTASQRSITLSSAPPSPRSAAPALADLAEVQPPPTTITPVTLVRQNLSFSKRNTMDTDVSSDVDPDDRSFFTRRLDEGESPISSIAPSVSENEKIGPLRTPSSAGILSRSDADSILSAGSESTSYSRKARPESLIVQPSKGPLVLGIALVDFDHLVGPKIEFSRGSIFNDEEIVKIMPFLALPDGAHMSTEDYSYFHLVPSSPNPKTIFGISCNRQIQTSELLVKDADVTRSTVQKAVVVLASEPVFGLIRDRLGVITRALFAQRDFSETSILDAFYTSLEHSLRTQLTESGLYMGTSLRELVHTFRQRTLVLLKALMLQKKIMFFGHPVEKLCTHQYSLVTLVPGLLQNLVDCGSPPLATRAQTLSRPTSLRTSDPKSMMAYVGLPLDLFGKDAFFQPYLPLQQLDMLRDTESWLCGSTNSIVAQQKAVDILVNIENGTMEFHDPKLERSAGLTPADRKWMDDIVRDVNETYDEDPSRPLGMHFKGSDDYLRQKFDEYINGALASVKYSAFLAKGRSAGVIISDGSVDPNSVQDFNALWIQEFKKTNAYEVWERVTDPLLFDIVEARHPCSDKPSVVADLGLRLSEGIQELKIEQQLAPTREAISRTFTAAVEGVRGRWLPRNPSSSTSVSAATASSPSATSTNTSTSTSSSIVEVSKTDAQPDSTPGSRRGSVDRRASETLPNGLRPLSMTANRTPPPPPPPEPSRFSGWVGSLFSPRSSRMSTASAQSTPAAMRRGSNSTLAESRNASRGPSPLPAMLASSSAESAASHKEEVVDEHIEPKNLDEVYGAGRTHKATSQPVDAVGEAHGGGETHPVVGDHHDEGDDDAPAGTGVAL
ncbi:predicted protein [Sparassis crispa]|uniref:UDENN domain-containing protein n=1 Tax=Sparassis crispa TaxID=139825 RepID=A0A401GLH8_9APHY|nr:predicted protein [Sparassis crispa]GBE83012.1 predicted protein [Sparassis crispa]